MTPHAFFVQLDPPGRVPGLCWQASLHAEDDNPPYPLAIAWLTDFRGGGVPGLGVSLDFILVPDHCRRMGYATALVAACRDRWGEALWLTDAISESGKGLLEAIEAMDHKGSEPR